MLKVSQGMAIGLDWGDDKSPFYHYFKGSKTAKDQA